MPAYVASDNLPGKPPDLYKKPKSLKSGEPLRQKVIITHRSDMLLEEQMENVYNVTAALTQAIEEVEKAVEDDERAFLLQQVDDLKERYDQMMVVLKICHKINSELVYARKDLQKSLKVGGDVTTARKRVGWLEDRMERLLGKKRQISPLGGDAGRGRGGGDGKLDFDDDFSDFSTVKQSGLSESLPSKPSIPKQQEPITEEERDGGRGGGGGLLGPGGGDWSGDDDSDLPPQAGLIVGALSSGVSEHEPMEQGEATPKLDKKKKKKKAKKKKGSQHGDYLHGDYERGMSGVSPVSTIPSEAMAFNIKVAAQQAASSSGTDTGSGTSEADSATSSASSGTSSPAAGSDTKRDEDAASGRGVFHLTEQQTETDKQQAEVSARSKPASGSKVTIKSPPPAAASPTAAPAADDAADAYWSSEHHRFQYSDQLDSLLGLDPLSYHTMGLAVPGTFVNNPDTSKELPWRPAREETNVSDINQVAFERLHSKVQRMYTKVREASMLSVKESQERDAFGPSLLSQFEIDDHSSTTRDLAQTDQKPSMARLGVPRPSSRDTVTFPPLKDDRLGSSVSHRLVYYPNPLPYPEKLPLTRTNRNKEYPRTSDHFSMSVPGKEPPAQRICDQRNLLQETKFGGTLYKAKLKPGNRANSTEDKFKAMLSDDGDDDDDDKTKPTPRKQLKKLFTSTLGAIKFQDEDTDLSLTSEGKWRQMKPNSGAFEHTGLKWERIKSLVHDNLISPNDESRLDACRHLGQLRCGDTMVMFALRERLRHDENSRVVYEAAKALVSLGSWDEEVLQVLVHYLLHGNSDIRHDLLTTLNNARNIHFVDKTLPSFGDLSELLSALCRSRRGDAADDMSFAAAVCLGKLCVRDAHALRRLVAVLEAPTATINTRLRAQALEILVRQLSFRDAPCVVDAVMLQLQTSPVWKLRKAAAKLIVHLGPVPVFSSRPQDAVYAILERRLWDEPNRAVRVEVAKAIAALDLFPVACERIEKKLEDPSEEVRSQAVISIGTLGMKNERIMRQLIEMVELDSSEYVRLMILRTFADLKSTDKRVVRALKDKDRGDNVLARAARKTMEELGIPHSGGTGPGASSSRRRERRQNTQGLSTQATTIQA